MNDKDPKKEVIYKSARSVLDRGIVRLEDTRYNIYSPDSIHNNYRCYDYNGASVIISGKEDNPLGYEIVYHDDSHTRVDCLRLTLRQEAKMAAIFDNLPLETYNYKHENTSYCRFALGTNHLSKL